MPGSLARPLTLVFLGALAALLFVHEPAAAQGNERILSFDSRIEVHPDASMTVTETITILGQKKKFKRGIFRDFPTTYEGRHGETIRVDLEVLEVLRNGRPEPYHTERRSNGVRVYVGQENVFIPAGEHAYAITYRTNRQLGFFEDFDELYWNVTGNDWAFVIDRASATVILPPGARVTDWAAYTGPSGARGRDYARGAAGGAAFAVAATRALEPGEGLTIAIAWPKCFVAEPDFEDQAGYFLRDNASFVAGVAGLIIVLIYFLGVWIMVGRDPAKGTIMPQYGPPEDFSPAAARFVTRMDFDDKAFTAAIVNMAVRGYLTIEEDGDQDYTLHKTGRPVALSPGERAAARKLFAHGRDKIPLKQVYHKDLQKAQKALRNALKTEFEKAYFLKNTGYFVPGAVITVLVAVLIVILGPDPLIAGFMSVWLTIWSIGCYGLWRKIASAWQLVQSDRNPLHGAGLVFIILFSLPFFGFFLVGVSFFAEGTSLPAAFILAAMLAIVIAFYDLMKAPTRLGRKIMDRIEGFKLYLSVAEKDRMNFHNPPERTPELFEKFLPFALALGVEQAWSEQFADVLAAASQSPGGGGYQPRWYSGSGFRSGDLGGFTSSLGGSFSGAISSASSAPGSSGGSGGGGSSGGGGGGGGGGSW